MTPIFHIAPLRGLTNYIFRQAYANHFPGFDFALAPFITSVNSTGSNRNHFKDLLPENNPNLPVIPQILSNNARDILTTIKILAELGYKEFNWNLGCPLARIANKYRGSGVLPYPELVEKILTEVCSHSPLQISVKVRLGRRDPDEILHVIPILNEFPLKQIIIHPRIGTQQYLGEVDLVGFSRAAALSKHEIVYNGDIKNVTTFEALQSKFPFVNQWMIGRWALRNPFLIGKLKKTVSASRPLQALKSFYADLYEHYKIVYKPANALDKMKGYWEYMSTSFPQNPEKIQQIIQADSEKAYDAATRELFSVGQWWEF